MDIKSWKIALTFGLPWSALMLISGTVLRGAFSALIIISALVAGALVGWVLAILIRYAAMRLYDGIVVETSSEEKLLKEHGASRFKDEKAIRGKLVLTDKQLIFKSPMVNIRHQQSVIFLDEIANVSVTRRFGLVTNGLSVQLHNQSTYRFIVSDSKSWFRLIQSLKHGTFVRLYRPDLHFTSQRLGG